VARGDTDALNLRQHPPPLWPSFSRWLPCAQGRNCARRSAPNRRLPLSSKRTFTHVPVKTALVLTGSAIALVGYIGASSNDTGHRGQGARQAALTAGLTASRRVQAGGPGDAGSTGLPTGLSTGLTTGDPGT